MGMSRGIDWTKLGWCMTQQVNAGSARPKSIDFAAYKAALPAQADWVAKMESQFNETVVPKPADKLSAAVAAEDDVYSEMAESSCAALDSAATDAQAEFDKLSNLPPVNQMTNSDVYSIFPELNPYSAEEMAKHMNDPSFLTSDALDGGVEEAKANRQKNKAHFYGAQ